MIEKVRNALIPPPAVIVGIALLGTWVFSGANPADRVHTRVNEMDAASTQATTTSRLVQLSEIEKDDDALDLISTKPLFLEDRQPWKVRPVAEPLPAEPAVPPPVVLPDPMPEPVKPDPPEIVLLGIMRDEDHVAALVASLDGQNERWIELGTTIEQWNVVEIRSDGIVLRAEGEETVVSYNR